MSWRYTQNSYLSPLPGIESPSLVLFLGGSHTCFILASSLRVCSSFLRSFLFPTRMMGTLGQKCFTSGVHFSGIFAVPEKKRKEVGMAVLKKEVEKNWTRTNCAESWCKQLLWQTSLQTAGGNNDFSCSRHPLWQDSSTHTLWLWNQTKQCARWALTSSCWNKLRTSCQNMSLGW